jgi:tripartite ATP-independent transporter DctM subunit
MTGVAHFISMGNYVYFNVMIQRVFAGIDNIGLTCIPFFILAGEVMNAGGVTKKLIDFVREIVGFARGGLAYAAVIIGAILSAILGSANAVASILGTVLVPEMIKDGYPDDFSASLVASAGILGPIIPPSVTFVFFSVITGVSVAGLFKGGIIPGICLGCGFAINIILYTNFKKRLPKSDMKFDLVRFAKALFQAIPALVIPTIIVGGIMGGLFTPTESGAVSVVAAFLASIFYGSFNFREIPRILIRSAKATAGIFIIIGFGNIMGWSFAIDKIPQLISNTIMSVSDSPTVIILIMLAILVFIGCFMEATAAILIFAPVMMPIAISIGMDPIHFGVIFCIMMTVALITPPVGMVLFVTSNITGVSLDRISKAVIPFAVMSILVTTVLAFMPDVVLYIPRILGQ